MTHKHNTHDKKEIHEDTFESSFIRLEEILEKLNSSTLSLEDSLKLYEEADSLIIQCHKKLTSAERKVEMLMKNRAGELQLTTQGSEAKPAVQEMHLS